MTNPCAGDNEMCLVRDAHMASTHLPMCQLQAEQLGETEMAGMLAGDPADHLAPLKHQNKKK